MNSPSHQKPGNDVLHPKDMVCYLGNINGVHQFVPTPLGQSIGIGPYSCADFGQDRIFFPPSCINSIVATYWALLYPTKTS